MRKVNYHFKSCKIFVLIVILLLITLSLSAQTGRRFLFSEVPNFMDGRWYGDSDFGDYDNDGDLDILTTGYGMTSGQGNINLYRNDGNQNFTDIPLTMDGVGNGVCNFVDFDNDGDLDIFISGQKVYGTDFTGLYENNDGSFTEIANDITPLTSASSDWGDFDKDGYLDLLFTGSQDTKGSRDIAVSLIYTNQGDGSFGMIDPAIIDVEDGSARWGDYDNDGDLDIAITGRVASSDYQTHIYRNDEGTFTNINAGMVGVRYSRLDWGDYDADGDIDLLVTGSQDNAVPSETHIYRNDGNDNFVDINANILGVRQGDIAWGDLQNMGNLDIFMNGLYTSLIYCGHVYYFSGSSYVFEDSLISLKYADIKFGDYNADNNLDIVLTGRYDYQDYKATLYQNDMLTNNTPPLAPTMITTSVVDSTVTIYWNAGSDNETPENGLSYNLWIGTATGTDDIIPAHADLSNGFRRIAKRGNMGSKLEYTIPSLPENTYYCAVQAIDNSYIGSDFTNEVQFEISNMSTDTNNHINFTKLSNYPNPFTQGTTINFNLKSAANLKLEIYNIKGHLVKTHIDNNLSADYYQVEWNGNDDEGNNVSPGIYFYRITDGKTTQTKKMIMIQ